MEKKQEVRVGIRELRGNLTRYVSEARRGTSVLVTSRGKAVAELRGIVAEDLPPRQLGGLKGRIWIADDFDTWPQDILDSFEAPLDP